MSVQQIKARVGYMNVQLSIANTSTFLHTYSDNIVNFVAEPWVRKRKTKGEKKNKSLNDNSFGVTHLHPQFNLLNKQGSLDGYKLVGYVNKKYANKIQVIK